MKKKRKYLVRNPNKNKAIKNNYEIFRLKGMIANLNTFRHVDKFDKTNKTLIIRDLEDLVRRRKRK